MHLAALQFCENVAKVHQVRGPGLDIGGRDVNGTARSFWPHVNWTIIDKEPDTGVVHFNYTDHHLNTKGSSPFHIVLCTEVLEHEKDWDLLIEHAGKDLESGGMLVLTCAGLGRQPHSGIDGGRLREDEHYENIDPDHLKTVLMMSGFSKRGHIIDNYTEHDLYVLAFRD